MHRVRRLTAGAAAALLLVLQGTQAEKMWLNTYGGEDEGATRPGGLAVNAKGESCIAGNYGRRFFGTGQVPWSIGSFELPPTPTKDYNGYVAKVDAEGKVLWATPIVSYTNEIFNEQVIIDKRGNCVATGWFQSNNVTIGSGHKSFVLKNYVQTTTGDSRSDDIYVVKFHGKTGEPMWATRIGGPSDDRSEGGLVTDGKFIYVAGYHGQKLPLNEPYPLAMGGHKDKEEITVPQYGSDDVMLVKLSARTGKVLAAKAWGNDYPQQMYTSLAYDSKRRTVFMCGSSTGGSSTGYTDFDGITIPDGVWLVEVATKTMKATWGVTLGTQDVLSARSASVAVDSKHRSLWFASDLTGGTLNVPGLGSYSAPSDPFTRYSFLLKYHLPKTATAKRPASAPVPELLKLITVPDGRLTFIIARALAIGKKGSVFVIGAFEGPTLSLSNNVTLDSGWTNLGSPQRYIAHFDASGNPIQGSTTIITSTETGGFNMAFVAVDKKGYVYYFGPQNEVVNNVIQPTSICGQELPALAGGREYFVVHAKFSTLSCAMASKCSVADGCVA